MTLVLILTALITATSAIDAPPVKIQLFYDSYCKPCKDFITQQLHPTWTELKDIIDVELFPFGNDGYSQVEGDEGWIFNCQHGQDECLTNMIHACAKSQFKDIALEIDFVNCILSADVPYVAGPTCTAEAGLDWQPIQKCSTSIQGQQLLHDIAVQQEQLDPELYFVPWIIVNGETSLDLTEECISDFKRIICETYNGTQPEPCGGMENNIEDIFQLDSTSI